MHTETLDCSQLDGEENLTSVPCDWNAFGLFIANGFDKYLHIHTFKRIPLKLKANSRILGKISGLFRQSKKGTHLGLHRHLSYFGIVLNIEH